MDFRQLLYFVRVVELKSLSRASEVLHVAQPALGLQIKKLEEELRVQLLIRHSRGVEATGAGRLLLSHANAILAGVEKARQELRDFGGPPAGDVTIGLTPGLTEILSAPLVRACARDLPEVSLHILELLSGELTQQIALNGMSMSFAITSAATIDDTSEIVSEPLLREDLFLVGNRETLPGAGEAVPFGYLNGRKLVVLGTSVGNRSQGLLRLLEAASITAGFELDIGFEMQSVAAVKNLVREGFGLGILPSGTVSKRGGDGDLVAQRIVQPTISRTLHLVRSRRRPLSKAEDLVAGMLRELIRNEIASGAAAWSEAAPSQ